MLKSGLFQTTFKIGSQDKIAVCILHNKQIKPLILGMQTLLEFGFSFGIGKSIIKVDPILPNPDEEEVCLNKLSINQQLRINESKKTNYKRYFLN